jgi:hypothetical protein
MGAGAFLVSLGIGMLGWVFIQQPFFAEHPTVGFPDGRVEYGEPLLWIVKALPWSRGDLRLDAVIVGVLLSVVGALLLFGGRRLRPTS